MIELMILGFLAEGPHHGYELRRQLTSLHGYARPISEGTLYPAIKRLLKAGLVSESVEAGGSGAPRRMLHLTDAGRERLHERLRHPSDQEVSDPSSFIVILAFLSQLPDGDERRAVLRRRLEFLARPASFFTDDGRPVRMAEVDDPYRRGIFVSARASRQAEIHWLQDTLEVECDRG